MLCPLVIATYYHLLHSHFGSFLLTVAKAKSPNKTMFFLGQIVEVIGSDKHYLGSFYKARVVSRIGVAHYEVQYLGLKDSAVHFPLRDRLHFGRLRPLPVARENHFVVPGDEIDCFFQEGWWHGYAVHFDWDTKCFKVYFEISDEHLMVPPSKCRAHVEWVNNEWVG